MDWLQANWEGIVIAYAAATALATAIVNLTPTPTDDDALAGFYRWIERVAGIITRKAKQGGDK